MATGNLDLKTSWGPFSPTYLGISHILDRASGSMADLALYIGRCEPRTVVVPENTFDYVQNIKSGDRRATVRAMPENVSADYTSFSIRYFLDAHGDTALAHFTVEDDERIRCEITFRNSSGEERKYFYGLGMTIADAGRKVRLKENLSKWWIAARDYTEIEAYQKAFGLGCRQCLTRVFNWGVESEVLAQAFGGWLGDRVSYKKTLPKALQNGFIYLRYVKYGTVSQKWELKVNGYAVPFSFPQTWAIPGGGWGKNRDAYEEWRLLRISVGRIPEKNVSLELKPVDAPGNDMARIWLDGMLFSDELIPGDDGKEILLPTSLVDEVSLETAHVETVSCSGTTAKFIFNIGGETARNATVTAEKVPISAENGSGSFLASLRKQFNVAPPKLERDSTVCPWSSLNCGPFPVPAKSEKTTGFTISFDSAIEKTTEAIPELRLGQASPSTVTNSSNMEGFACQNRSLNSAINSSSKATTLPHSKTLQHNAPYSEMISRLKDILLFNVNYPLKISKAPSPYFVPAKYFPIPYSWDGGFTALGLANFAPDLALQQTCYFFADKEYDFPFLYAGSPVPTQFYSLWEAYEEKKDLSVLSGAYSGAKRMYDFFLGRTPSSIVNAHGDGFLSTYPYNYNLGIDDHPIQRWAEECQLTKKGLYSIILMAQMLRIARIMRNMAFLLGNETDSAQYGLDVKLLTDNIDNSMWDEKSGLYCWAHRTGNGVEKVVMNGCSGDRSGCAFLPLFAGLTTHKDSLVRQLSDPSRFSTPYGISSVDMQAPYYNPNGYWNGGIWPVMQWYIWRGLIEAGEPALARKLADTILTTWHKCFEKEHYLGEHFMIAPAQMNGAPNFGGLSAVLVPMHAAYYKPYQITSRYDVIILSQSVDKDKDTLKFQLSAPFLSADSHNLLVNMGRPKTTYSLTVNGKLSGKFVSDEFGHMVINIPRPVGKDELAIIPAIGQ